MHTYEKWPSVAAASAALGVTHQAVTQAIRRHGRVAGRFLVFDMADAYCECCKAKIDQQMKEAA